MKTVDIISSADATLHLTRAILLYQSSGGYSHVYASSHPIDIDASNPERRCIGAGTPMQRADLISFAAAIHTQTAHAGFLPSNLLYTSPNLMAWLVPAAVRTTWFKTNCAQIGNAHGLAAHPALVFFAGRGGWHVFALRESARPTPDTSLYHAPHFNVNDSGRICTGNVQIPDNLGAEAMAGYENAFFRSHFTHTNRQKPRAVRGKGGLTALWASQLASPDADAMQRALVPAKETLRTVIERITHSRNDD
ncbi:PRTRC system protein B [Janthinobacterium sp. LS2A]|uniref:PRTRC system protein B n=1 Tax=Janthinobacterium sp. LS2A TaxID=3118590 RepID=UPI002F925681